MKIEMQITERDKKLLVFLAIFVIVVGLGYWGIRPSILKMMEIHEEKLALEEQQFLDDMKLAELEMIEDENEKFEEQIKEARSHFYPMMTSSEIDKLMTGLALKYNLNAYDLAITMPVAEAESEAYQYSQKYEEDLIAAEEALLEQMELEAQREAALEEAQNSGKYDEYEQYFDDMMDDEEEVGTGIYIATVNMRVGGDAEDLQAIINELSRPEQTMQLVNYDWVRSRELIYNEKLSEYDVVFVTTLSLVIDIYMCEE